MVNQIGKATEFAKLHVKGTPLVLYNAWDAGSAKAVADGGAQWPSQQAVGPLRPRRALRTGRPYRLICCCKPPVRSCGPLICRSVWILKAAMQLKRNEVGQNAARLLDSGAIGLNFEDRIVGGDGLHPVADQARKIAAIRAAAEAAGVPLFINARSDVFFQKNSAPHADLMERSPDPREGLCRCRGERDLCAGTVGLGPDQDELSDSSEPCL